MFGIMTVPLSRKEFLEHFDALADLTNSAALGNTFSIDVREVFVRCLRAEFSCYSRRNRRWVLEQLENVQVPTNFQLNFINQLRTLA